MNWYKRAQQAFYEYIGDCMSTVDESCIWDATEMAQLVEGSMPCDANEIIPFASEEIKIRFKDNPNVFDCGINRNIVWLHDMGIDIHYFYKKTA